MEECLRISTALARFHTLCVIGETIANLLLGLLGGWAFFFASNRGKSTPQPLSWVSRTQECLSESRSVTPKPSKLMQSWTKCRKISWWTCAITDASSQGEAVARLLSVQRISSRVSRSFQSWTRQAAATQLVSVTSYRLTVGRYLLVTSDDSACFMRHAQSNAKDNAESRSKESRFTSRTCQRPKSDSASFDA